jgi:tetratricopeptide (TPR) repeat protein
MSFEVTCSGCGAASGPSVGVCPFCKTVMASVHDKNSEQKKSVLEIYESGRLDLALAFAKKMFMSDPESKKDASFILLYVKILLETEGPTSLIKGLLAEAHLFNPKEKNIIDYIELVEAKDSLKKGLNDAGEIQLKNLLRRSPSNVHAHFILGTHLFWMDEQMEMAIPHLETCVRLAPKFLRAWGCLGAIYKKLGNSQLSCRAFQKCIELEPNSNMKEFFQKEIKAA